MAIELKGLRRELADNVGDTTVPPVFVHARNSEVAIESIAVLPFENRSNAADTEYLFDGLAESLIYRLSQLPNLKVSPTSSCMKGITKKYTDNNEAYQLYLKGRFHFAKRTKEDLSKSIEIYEQAVKLDPKFAFGYVGIAESWAVIPSYPKP